jgi:cytochrome c-type biogenesis protein CcmH
MTLRIALRPLAPFIIATALSLGTAHAYTLEEFTFDNPAQTEDFRDLIGELRCLVCQNESLAGSQASVAQDLRKEVYRMMQEGKSRQEVVDFLVARYGDFVLYEPPIKPSTYILWLGPFVFVGLGAFLLLRTLQRKKAEPEAELTETERARLRQVLASTDAKKE